jgi:putative glutamine amidotransferase
MAPGLYQDFVFRNYPRSVFQAGGQPVLIPVAPDPEAALDVLDRLDALVLTGGPDVAPHLYGRTPLPGLETMDLERDHMEWALARSAWDRELPTLGICRGVQLMNVVHGGDLYQDIGHEAPEAGLHAVMAPKSVVTHPVVAAAGTRLARIVGEGRIDRKSVV